MANKRDGQLAVPCRTMRDLDTMLRAAKGNPGCVPMILESARNLVAPISRDDKDWLSQSVINLFQRTPVSQDETYSQSSSLIDEGITFGNPFVALGCCIIAFTEPAHLTIKGNQFGSIEHMEALNLLPASPIVLRNNATYINALFTGAAHGDVDFWCPSDLDVGGSVLEGIWAFMQAFSLVVECPGSTYKILMDEKLHTIGNCMAQMDYEGFGSSELPHIAYARMANNRLKELSTLDHPGLCTVDMENGDIVNANGDDPGYFVPINSDQNADAEIVPYRYTPEDAAFGRVAASPSVLRWRKFPVPIPYVPEWNKIKITLQQRQTGDRPYLRRALQQLSMKRCMGPVAALPGVFRIDEEDHAADTTGGMAGFTHIPFGRLRLAVAILGFECGREVCEELDSRLTGGTFQKIVQAYPSLDLGGGVCETTLNAPSGCVPIGSVCGPDGKPR